MKKKSPLSRRRFIRKFTELGVWGAVGSWLGSLPADEEPGSDQLGDTLPRRTLGRTGVNVTMLGLGGAHCGAASDKISEALIEAAMEGGVRFFDTAQQYQNGGSESKYGRFLTPKYREHIFLMTKTLARDADSARKDLEGALRRLKTDHLDLWQMHGVDSPDDVDKRKAAGVFEVMQEAKASGKTRFLGFTGHRQPAAHQRVLETTNLFDVCQMPINALDSSYHSFIKNVLPKLVEGNLGVLAMKTLSDGGFFGANNWSRKPTGKPALIPTRLSVQEALHFVWSLPVTVLITGAETVEQLREKIALAKAFKPMSEQARQEIIAKVAEPGGKYN